MLTVKNNVEDLKKILINNTPVVSVSIFFDENNKVGISMSEGKVLYTTSDRVCWKAPHRKNRTLIIKTFGQLLPGLNVEKVTFYGLFLKENDQKVFIKKILKSAESLRNELLKMVTFLDETIVELESISKDEEKEENETK